MTDRENRAKHLTQLQEEYEAANKQLDYTLDDVLRLRLKRRITALEEEINAVEAGGPFTIDPSPKLQAQDKAAQASTEQSYRDRLIAHYDKEAPPYYIPLSAETTEAPPDQPGTTWSARRRHKRAQAEYRAWVEAGQEIKRVKLATLQEGIEKYPCIILLGDPGSGKTTALENLAYRLAGEDNLLPIPLRLSEFLPGMSLTDFIVQHGPAPELMANLDEYLANGRLFFLFDALNEMPKEGYAERVQALRSFINKGTDSFHPLRRPLSLLLLGLPKRPAKTEKNKTTPYIVHWECVIYR